MHKCPDCGVFMKNYDARKIRSMGYDDKVWAFLKCVRCGYLHGKRKVT